MATIETHLTFRQGIDKYGHEYAQPARRLPKDKEADCVEFERLDFDPSSWYACHVTDLRRCSHWIEPSHFRYRNFEVRGASHVPAAEYLPKDSADEASKKGIKALYRYTSPGTAIVYRQGRPLPFYVFADQVRQKVDGRSLVHFLGDVFKDWRVRRDDLRNLLSNDRADSGYRHNWMAHKRDTWQWAFVKQWQLCHWVTLAESAYTRSGLTDYNAGLNLDSYPLLPTAENRSRFLFDSEPSYNWALPTEKFPMTLFDEENFVMHWGYHFDRGANRIAMLRDTKQRVQSHASNESYLDFCDYLQNDIHTELDSDREIFWAAAHAMNGRNILTGDSTPYKRFG